MSLYRDLIPLIVEREGATLPDGYDTWGIESTAPDLTTRAGFRWPHTAWPPSANRAGEGLTVAHTWAGMTASGFPARTLILVATAEADRLTHPGALRSRWARAVVVAIVDGERLLRESGKGADLHGADLSGADLTGADLRRTDLTSADLRRTYLAGADLRRADLYAANLAGADLSAANLAGADLTGANLAGADLSGANLYDANLTGANLTGAYTPDPRPTR